MPDDKYKATTPLIASLVRAPQVHAAHPQHELCKLHVLCVQRPVLPAMPRNASGDFQLHHVVKVEDIRSLDGGWGVPESRQGLLGHDMQYETDVMACIQYQRGPAASTRAAH
jgi:hypothetical protein